MIGNLSSRSRGFNSLPVKASQPAGSSFAWVMATSLVKRRQQVLKPRGSPEIDSTLKPLLSLQQGQHRRDRHWRGNVGSAGADRGKGKDGPPGNREIPLTSTENAPAIGSPADNDPGPKRVLPPPGSAGISEHEPWRDRVGTGSETNK